MSFTDTFQSDYNQLVADGKQLKEEIEYRNQAIQQYHEAYEKATTTHNPLVAFTMFMFLIANQGLDQLNSQTAIHGGGLKIQSDITKLNGDVENITNQNVSNTKANPNQGSKLVIDVANHLDVLVNLTTFKQGSSSDLQNEIQEALGGTADSAMNTQFGILRGQIKYGGNTPNTPYYFDPTGANGKIDSYGQLQADLKERGDTQGANEAEKQKTNAFNQNTATTQSTNAATQEKLSNDANTTKAIQAFVVDGLHAINDVESAAIKATTRG